MFVKVKYRYRTSFHGIILLLAHMMPLLNARSLSVFYPRLFLEVSCEKIYIPLLFSYLMKIVK